MTMFAIILLFVSACSGQQNKQEKVEITVSAAASLQEAMMELIAAFEKEYPSVTVHVNFGGSGALKQQISKGAPVDLFFSAGEKHINELVAEGLLSKELTINVVKNQLALIVSEDVKQEVKDLKDLQKVQQIAVGNPETVPAGQYAKEALEQSRLWEILKTKVVTSKDVRQVLTYVETGNVDAGIVYKTDALLAKDVISSIPINETLHSPIVYPLGVVSTTKHEAEAKQFLHFIQEEKSVEILKKFGFSELNET
nr:molybdate ABC transporter substrate-binding protein [Bacillus sp. FJAT-47783]